MKIHSRFNHIPVPTTTRDTIANVYQDTRDGTIWYGLPLEALRPILIQNPRDKHKLLYRVRIIPKAPVAPKYEVA